ncbi:MAG: 7TM-DISM domain-containing protein [Rhodospirillaceae bacterium]
MALDPGKPTRLYLRLSGVTSPFVSARILPLKQFISNEGVDLLILAGVLGFITAMLVYNLVVYVRSRLHQCLYYFLYLAFIIIHVVIYDGLIYRFSDFTLSGHVADILSQSSGVAAGLSLLLFGRALLRLPQTAPRLSKLTLWFSAVTIFILFLEIIRVLPYATISSVVLILSGFIMSGCAVYFALRGVKPALYFSFSFLALFIGCRYRHVWVSLSGCPRPGTDHLGKPCRRAAKLVVPPRHLRRSGADLIRHYLLYQRHALGH